MTTDEYIGSIDERLFDGKAPSDGDVAFLIIELSRARQVFRDLLTANSSHDEAWVKGRARYGLGET